MRTLLALALFLPLTANAVPLEFTHQGRLLDSTGAPLDGSLPLRFALYDVETGGTALWSEDTTGDFTNGYYTSTLAALQAVDFDGDDVWLGITVDGGTELDRVKLASVPFAIRSLSADTAVSADTATNLDGGTINATSITVNGITIVDGSGVLAASPAVHTHHADDIDDGILGMSRIPVGTSDTTVARGNHGHDLSTLTGDTIPGDLNVTGDLNLGIPGTCDSTNVGALSWDAAQEKVVVCHSDVWNAVWPPLSPGEQPSTAGTSCASLLSRGVGTDGVYWLNPTGSSAFQAYCDQTTDGGGWTLALKTAASGSAFTFYNPLWDTAGVLNETDMDPTVDADAKLDAFDEAIGDEIRGCFDDGTGSVSCKLYPLPGTDTLLNTFSTVVVGSPASGDSFAWTETPAEKIEWLTMMGLTDADTSCGNGCAYRETGINIDDDVSCYQARVRFGIALNNESNISTLNDAAGFGASAYCASDCSAAESCWKVGGGLQSSSVTHARFGHVWIR